MHTDNNEFLEVIVSQMFRYTVILHQKLTKFSSTSFPWQCKWKKYDKIFLDKDTCQGKTCQGR